VPIKITATRASDSRFVLLFDEEECSHKKHIARIGDYTFLFCSHTKNPVALYCGSDIKDEQDVLEFISSLTEAFVKMAGFKSLLNPRYKGRLGTRTDGVIESPYFSMLARKMLDVSEINLV
jgi:hypothetical protein